MYVDVVLMFVCVCLKGPWLRKLWDQSFLKTSLSLSGSLLRCLSQTVSVVTPNLFIDRNMRLQYLRAYFSFFPPSSLLISTSLTPFRILLHGLSMRRQPCSNGCRYQFGDAWNSCFTVDNVYSKLFIFIVFTQQPSSYSLVFRQPNSTVELYLDLKKKRSVLYIRMY